MSVFNSIYCVLGALSGLLLSLGLASIRPAAATDDPPNILFIFADDWGWGDLGCHGHPYVRTPNIDRLAREGTDFHRFTVASGVCSPSRTAVMTGHFPARYNIDGHFAWAKSNAKRNMPDWLDPDVITLPRILQDAGYATAHFGKWHLSNNMIPDSPTPDVYGYDTYGAFNCAGEQIPVHEDSRNAIKFIQQCNESQKPFFVNLWIHEPHTPFHTVPKYRWWFRDGNLSETDEIYASVLAHADDRIGDVLDTLDRLKISENTLVIFTSDNGPARSSSTAELTLMHDTATGAGYGIAAAKGITAGRKAFKAALFEGGINVPFIVRWPGKVSADVVNNQSMISAVDLLPTFCEIAGADLPTGYQPDGISQARTLTGDDVEKDSGRAKPLFWKMQARWPPAKSKPYHWVAYATLDERWKLLANQDLSHTELYDVVADPLELNDLAESHTDVTKSLLDSIRAWQTTLPQNPNSDLFSAERDAAD